MAHRPLPSLAVLAIVIASAPAASAAEVRKFEASAFTAAQAQGRPILIDVHADWCPTCRAQAPLIAQIIKAPEYSHLVVFKLDYDKQKAD